ncbi:MAG: HIT family protein [Promethearchaeota archaeon]
MKGLESEDSGSIFTRSIVAQGKFEYIQGRTRRMYECIFCEVVKKNPNLVAHELFADEFILVMLNLYPYNAGHLLVLPKAHVESLNDLNTDSLARLFSCVQACQKILRESFKPTGFNVGINEGANSGQSVKHLHVHVVPRFPNELGFLDIVGGTRTIPLNVEQVHKRLSPKFKKIEYNGKAYAVRAQEGK